MTLLDLTSHRTRMFSDEQMQQIVQTHKGQAHFAGTGPHNATCRQCSHWAPFRVNDKVDYYSANSNNGPRPKPAECAKFKVLTGNYGPKVPHDAAACRHFERAENEPPLTNPSS